MSAKKWILFGCGGCSLVILVIGIGLAALAWYGASMVGEFTDKIASIEENKRQLEEQFPFTQPTDGIVSQERFEQYLNVRGDLIGVTETNLDWMIAYIQSSEESLSEPGIMDWISMPMTFLTLASTHTEKLFAVEMSSEEYSFITRQMMAEIHSWRDESMSAEKQQFAESYFALLVTMNTSIEEVKQENPSSHIEIGPFTMSKVITTLEGVDISGHPYEAMILANMEAIGSSDAAILFDAFVIDTEQTYVGGDQSWEEPAPEAVESY